MKPFVLSFVLSTLIAACSNGTPNADAGADAGDAAACLPSGAACVGTAQVHCCSGAPACACVGNSCTCP